MQEKFTNDECIGCEGVCQKWFHSNCVSITAPELRLISKNRNLKWMCDECNGQYVHMVDTSVKKIMGEMMESMKIAMEKMVSSKLTELMKKSGNIRTNNKENVATYANKVKEGKEEVIIVHPKSRVRQVRQLRGNAKRN